MANSIQALANELGVNLLEDNKTHTNRMEIMSSSSDRIYIVAQAKSGKNEGQWQCSCPGWINHRTCKHLKAMMPALQSIEAPKQKPLQLVSDPFAVKKTSKPAKKTSASAPKAKAAVKAPKAKAQTQQESLEQKLFDELKAIGQQQHFEKVLASLTKIESQLGNVFGDLPRKSDVVGADLAARQLLVYMLIGE